MGLRVNTNATAVTALRNLRLADGAQSRSLERLSTGLRINRASDDPSGLVISEQLRAQIKSLGQALENTTNASNLIGTAEAALAEVSRLLIDVRESALFALNTGGTGQEQIQAEQDGVDASIAAIDRIAASTRFGRTQLLDGSSALQVTQKPGQLTDVNLRSINFDGFSARTINVDITTVAAKASRNTTITTSANVVNTNGDVIFRLAGNRGTQTITLGASATGQDLLDAVNLVALNTGVYASADGGSQVYLRSIDFGSDAFITLEKIGGSGDFLTNQITSGMIGLSGVDVVGTINGNLATGKGNKLSLSNFSLDVEVELRTSATDVNYSATTYSFDTRKSGLNFQLNSEANPNDAIRVGLRGMQSALLGSVAQDVNLGGGTTLTVGGILASLRAGGANDLNADPGNAVRIVDAAIDDVNDLRAYLGSIKSNILDSNSRSLGIAMENLTSSESSIRDLDFAAETAEFTRTQILFQAGTAVLASANLIPQTILSLLQ